MYLGIPILVQVVDAGDAAAVTIGVVYVPNITCSISWVASHHCLGPLLDVVFAQPTPAVQDQLVDEGQEEADGFATLFVAPNPRDLVSPQVPFGDAGARPRQLAVPQYSVAVQLLDALQDAVAHHLAQEVVQVTEADLVQTGHDVLQGDFLQIQPHDVCQGHLARKAELGDPQRAPRKKESESD